LTKQRYAEEMVMHVCDGRAWEGWTAGKDKDLEMIFPEVSRVTRGRYEGQSATDTTRQLFNKRPRATVE